MKSNLTLIFILIISLSYSGYLMIKLNSAEKKLNEVREELQNYKYLEDRVLKKYAPRLMSLHHDLGMEKPVIKSLEDFINAHFSIAEKL